MFRATFDVPAGSYEYKVALNNSWDENYGAGGAPGGANIPITAPGGPVTFTYDHAHARDLRRRAAAAAGRARRALAARGRDRLAPARPARRRYRLHYAPEGGLAVAAARSPAARRCRSSSTPAGLPADVRAQFPHLAVVAGAATLSAAAQALAPSC